MNKLVAHCLTGLTVLLLGDAVANAQKPLRPSHSTFPSVTLDRAERGERAIESLRDNLPKVAGAYGLTSEELKRRFRQDRLLHVDRKGRLFFADELEFHGEEAAAPAAGSLAGAAAYPLDQTFLLHGRPGALRTIYLDFDGHTLSGTAWNGGYNGGNPMVCPPWDTDGNPGSFSDAERTAIQEIWQRVAEDYAAFDVDVTTEYPGEAALTRSSSSDPNFGVRVLISPISSYFGAYGGIAYIGAFDDVGDYYKPPLVFPENLANGAKYIAEAASHEAGHNLGLYHDGTTTGSAYYKGQGVGEVGWAPIMGVGYYRNVTQWSKGEYLNANNTQDDLALITSYGLSYRPDDHGNSAGTASYFPAVPTFNATGVIERNTDVDVFAFSAGAGPATITVLPLVIGANLDVSAVLFNSSGTLVLSNKIATQLSASLSGTLPAGTYFLHVRGIGYGNPLSTGFSNYGSLGQYSVNGTVISPGGSVPPVAVASATPISGTAPLTVALDGSQSFDQDGNIVSYAWSFGDGQNSSGANQSHVYQSAGSYAATLTVTDNQGITDSDTVTINVQAPNTPPTAIMTATPSSGTAPLTVSFSSAGSIDPGGSIVSYAWNFGDGSTGSGTTAQHTYTGPGNYTATLTVTDNNGATATASTIISVQPNVGPVLHVASIQLVVDSFGFGKRVRAVVNVLDANNNPVSNAAVAGQWSGLVGGSSTANTSYNGNATFVSSRTRQSGTVTFKVTNVSKPGAAYESGQNVITQASINLP